MMYTAFLKCKVGNKCFTRGKREKKKKPSTQTSCDLNVFINSQFHFLCKWNWAALSGSHSSFFTLLSAWLLWHSACASPRRRRPSTRTCVGAILLRSFMPRAFVSCFTARAPPMLMAAWCALPLAGPTDRRSLSRARGTPKRAHPARLRHVLSWSFAARGVGGKFWGVLVECFCKQEGNSLRGAEAVLWSGCRRADGVRLQLTRKGWKASKRVGLGQAARRPTRGVGPASDRLREPRLPRAAARGHCVLVLGRRRVRGRTQPAATASLPAAAVPRVGVRGERPAQPPPSCSPAETWCWKAAFALSRGLGLSPAAPAASSCSWQL